MLSGGIDDARKTPAGNQLTRSFDRDTRGKHREVFQVDGAAAQVGAEVKVKFADFVLPVWVKIRRREHQRLRAGIAGFAPQLERQVEGGAAHAGKHWHAAALHRQAQHPGTVVRVERRILAGGIEQYNTSRMPFERLAEVIDLFENGAGVDLALTAPRRDRSDIDHWAHSITPTPGKLLITVLRYQLST